MAKANKVEALKAKAAKLAAELKATKAAARDASKALREQAKVEKAEAATATLVAEAQAKGQRVLTLAEGQALLADPDYSAALRAARVAARPYFVDGDTEGGKAVIDGALRAAGLQEYYNSVVVGCAKGLSTLGSKAAWAARKARQTEREAKRAARKAG